MKFKKIVDLSVQLNAGTLWKREDIKSGVYGHRNPTVDGINPRPKIKGVGKWGTGDWVRPWEEKLQIRRYLEPWPCMQLLEEITMWAHSGTHVDSELQNDPNGECLSDMLLDRFCGECVTFDLSSVEVKIKEFSPPWEKEDVKISDLEAFAVKIKPGDFVFLFSDKEGQEIPILDTNGARWLCDRGIRGIGGDGSVNISLAAHEYFHSKRITMIDRLDPNALRVIKDKRVFIAAFPLNIKDISTSPCRVVAFLE